MEYLLVHPGIKGILLGRDAHPPALIEDYFSLVIEKPLAQFHVEASAVIPPHRAQKPAALAKEIARVTQKKLYDFREGIKAASFHSIFSDNLPAVGRLHGRSSPIVLSVRGSRRVFGPVVSLERTSYRAP